MPLKDYYFLKGYNHLFGYLDTQVGILMLFRTLLSEHRQPELPPYRECQPLHAEFKACHLRDVS